MTDAAENPGPAGFPGPAGASVLRQAFDGFRSWRRSRPFWAGIFLFVSGTELLAIPLPVHAMGLILHIGTGGVLGILIGAILMASALLLWFNPSQRIFYSIVAVLLAVAALVASNLGGFLFGTLLGVIGGSLGFAWTPAPDDGSRQRQGRRTPDQPGAPAEFGPGTSPQGVRPGDVGSGVRLGGVLPLVPALLAGLVAVVHPGAAGPRPNPSSSPSPSSCPSPSPSPNVSVGVGIGIGIGVGIGLGAGAGTGSCPSPSPSATPGPSGNPSPSPRTSPGLSPGANASRSPSPSHGGSHSPGRSSRPMTGTAPRVTVATDPASLAAASATITGFAYDGVVGVHTSAGTVQMMQFSMSSISLTGIRLSARQGAAVMTTQANRLDLNHKVVLYATELSGDLLGVPITITARSPVAAILQAIAPLTQRVPVSMTNVVTDQPCSSAASMSISGLRIS